MCLIVFSWKSDLQYKLILVANRDEFFERPTESARFRNDLLAGKDLQCGGTWLGATRRGKIAAITNFRDPPEAREPVKSRGWLVNEFLASDCSADHFVKQISVHKELYNPFNLLLYDGQNLIFYSSKTNFAVDVEPGIHALSNHQLDSDWPKVNRIKESLSALLSKDVACCPEDFFKIMGDSAQPNDIELPKTGVSLEWERRLAPIFIRGVEYGTRSTSLLRLDYQSKIEFIEKSHYPDRKSLITCEEIFIVPSSNQT